MCRPVHRLRRAVGPQTDYTEGTQVENLVSGCLGWAAGERTGAGTPPEATNAECSSGPNGVSNA